MTKVLFVRHGETVENKDKIVQGQIPGTLNETGIKQAKELALRLKDVKITHIYSSDLARAVDTTKEIMKYHPGVPVDYVSELRERNYGDWQGKKTDQVGWTLELSAKPGVRLGGGETMEEVGERTQRFISRLRSENREGIVLVVGHRNSGRVLVSLLESKAVEDTDDLKNSSVVEIELRN